MRTLHNTTVAAAVLAFGLPLAGCASSRSSGPRLDRGSESQGAPWTIRCLELPGEQGRAVVRRLSESLQQTPGIRADEVFVREDDDGFSRLYYGTYYRRIDPKTGRRNDPALMRDDLNLIRSLGADDTRRLFATAMPVRMPQPDVGDPAWDLRNVDARYSLQVAVFEPTEEFYEYKQAAVDFCTYLRDKGYEAYFYHAPASSSVTVGAFGDDAVRSRKVVRNGRVVYEAEYAPEVQRLQNEELLRHNLLNGAVYRVRNESGVSEPVPSRLVEVPRRDRMDTTDSADDPNVRSFVFPIDRRP